MSLDEVAEGVYRLGTAHWANFYLVLDGDEALLVDAGYPGYWRQVDEALADLGKPLNAITAAIVTHHHVDHTGTAERARVSAGATIFAHEDDAPLVRGERPSHPPAGFYRQAWRLSMARYLAHTVLVGGARYRPVAELQVLDEDLALDLPGRPCVLHVPGHTAGHCTVSLGDRGVLFCGDAMVNFDYAAGQRGLRQHRFNEDRELALASLQRLAGLNPEIILFGHGDPWREGLPKALEIVRAKADANGIVARAS